MEDTNYRRKDREVFPLTAAQGKMKGYASCSGGGAALTILTTG